MPCFFVSRNGPKTFNCVSPQWKLIFNFLIQLKLILKISVSRNGKKILTDSHKQAKFVWIKLESRRVIATCYCEYICYWI